MKPAAGRQSLLPEPSIKTKGRRFSKTYSCEILVRRIEQKVAFARNQNTWDLKHRRTASNNPFIADRPHLRRRRIGPPVPGQIRSDREP